MNKKQISESMAWVLAKYSDHLINGKKTSEEAFNATKHELVMLGSDEHFAANMIRLSVGVYLNDEQYVNGALNALVAGELGQ